MADTVEIAIGDSFAERHRNFEQQLGEQYEDRIRELLENEIHAVTQQLERQAEQQQPQMPAEPHAHDENE